MRIALDPRARRLLKRVPHTTVYTAAELALLGLLAIQCARLVWTAVTPVGPVGDWRAGEARVPLPAASAELLGSFDPFFRMEAAGGPAVVTALDIKLFGVREDRATGRGSAIIGTADGVQKSYAVGEEIMSGVTLSEVRFDGITITRNGAPEQVYLDQSTPADVASPVGSTPPPPPPPPPTPIPVQPVRTGPPPPVEGATQ